MNPSFDFGPFRYAPGTRTPKLRRRPLKLKGIAATFNWGLELHRVAYVSDID